MGLVKMALASEDLYYAFRPNALIVLGIAAGFSGPDGDVKICDVAVAKSIDLYFHRARNRMGHPLAGVFAVTAELREEQPIATSEELVAFATTDEGFAAERMQWSLRCAQYLEDDLKPFLRGVIFDSEKYGVAMCPEVR